ncbi:M24 family metallopeptidase [Sphingomonas ursincola]|uniref:M24 family metallopeptidase n=1 Tax=Sphingomonas ursincola TaxID=56361 RepID=A0A7V8RD91_9SPHN|nr:M24 family metallopeptidase [Sphingomonas ursincola]MBA1374283.1 M24 family metallopeptidase [Sphingomonas ursincola]
MKSVAVLLSTALAASLMLASPVSAQSAGNTAEAEAPDYPAILPLREQAKLRDAWLAQRLETVVPALMREQGVDMWVLIAREYDEDPVVATMLDARSMHARRRTILVFFDPGEGKPVERLTVSRYGLAGMFAPVWTPEQQPDQWKRLAEIVAERNPQKIAMNISSQTALADGLSHSQYEDFVAALPPEYRERIVPAGPLAIGWLESRIPAEMEVYPSIVRLAHAIIAEALSDKVITPGQTTAEDVQWWMREKISALGLKTWFHPSLAIFRASEAGELTGDAVIQPGDMLWTDFGITYLGLNTDTQHLAYVLKPGETDAPAGLKEGLAAANAVQDILTGEFRVGLTGNDLLAATRAKAIASGYQPSIYSHPIGFHGHGAGPAIGFWDNQDSSPAGRYLVRGSTAWSIELAVTNNVPEWGDKAVSFRTEEDMFFDGEKVAYLDGRQDRFHLIRGAADAPAETTEPAPQPEALPTEPVADAGE